LIQKKVGLLPHSIHWQDGAVIAAQARMGSHVISTFNAMVVGCC
jgi:hypothetical protein